MIVRSLAEIEGDEQRDVTGPGWRSRRLLLARDGMGFSLHDTVCHAGEELRLHYRNHLEAVYCIEGAGSIENLDDGKTHPLSPGAVYALDKNDRHILRPETRMRFVCVFNPPVTGAEVHDETGAYPASLPPDS
ncbi:MAG: ectoine synthase [Nitrospinota bacterium]|nr:ectoine synthase [Nitrospinota bacterium]